VAAAAQKQNLQMNTFTCSGGKPPGTSFIPIANPVMAAGEGIQ